ncbi:transcriptional regulator [Paenibacillus sp. BC26]|uniref:ArsR/SmtB family transcription factor n=1 Tax=Paenibacillus sp. BC26 TaxID=1881032 RepID=UPI0008E31740|nr:winged helix-turn-helix transcriptional regulator [Paenibacillus sp. BC26]SFT03998.1 Predicted transcriptional regulator [Paenibacillus sp. BC26]
MLELSINQPDKLVKVAHALSSHTRIGIIKLLLNTPSLNVVEIAHALEIPVSTAAINVKVLEEAGLILTELLPATRGAMKVCSRNFDDVRMILNPIANYTNANQTYEVEMPVGHYFNFEVFPTCGIAGVDGMLIQEDDPASFYNPACKDAEIIWLRQGWIEYRFPKAISGKVKVNSIEFSLELCSEAPNYNNNWPSDITVWINDVEIGSWLSPGDFGDHRGRLNPSWWGDNSTQYGLLKTWRVSNEYSAVDNVETSAATIQDLNLDSKPFISFRIGIKPDAKHRGGINLFGKNFGDHAQAIVMKIQHSAQ